MFETNPTLGAASTGAAWPPRVHNRAKVRPRPATNEMNKYLAFIMSSSCVKRENYLPEHRLTTLAVTSCYYPRV
jgi:hypothetical protein